MQKLSVVLTTFNEEKNLPGCLDSVKGLADEIIVVDGTSTDKTVEIAKKYGAKVVVVENLPNFHINKQKAIELATKDWILQLDADERVSPELADEIKAKFKKQDLSTNGYWMPRKNWFLGRFLMKGGQYPDYTLRLYRKGKGHLPQVHVHEQAEVEGRVEYLKHALLHYPYKNFSSYLVKWNRYNNLLATQIKEKVKNCNFFVKAVYAVGYLIIKPAHWFLTTYIRHKGFMDLWPGFVFSLFSSLRFPTSYIKYLKQNKRSSSIFVGVLFISTLFLALLLRIKMFLSGDFYLLADQGRDLQLVRDIVVNHKLTLIGGHAGFGGIFHGPLWWYSLVPTFIIFSGNPFFTLVPLYILVSMGIVIAGFILSKKLYNSLVGLLFAFILSISAFLVSTIYFTSNAQIMPLIFIPYLYCAIKYLRKNDKYLIPTFFLMGLGINFEAAFAVTLIPITFLLLLFRHKWPGIKLLFTSIVAFLISVGTYILFDLRHNFLMLNAVLSLLRGQYALSPVDAKYSDFGFRLVDRANLYFQSFRFPSFLNDQLSYYFILACVFLVISVLVYQSIKCRRISDKDKEYLFLLSIPILIYSLYVFIKIPLQGHYTMSLGIVFALLLTLTFYRLIKLSKLMGYALLFFFVAMQINPAVRTIINNYFNSGVSYSASNGSYKNELAVVDGIYEDANGQKFGYFVYDPPIVTYGMDYLMWWRGTYKYNYVPVSKKLPITYLILNPPAYDEGSHTFWINNTIRTRGKIISTKIYTGNIKVLKFSIPPGDPEPDPNYYQNLIFR